MARVKTPDAEIVEFAVGPDGTRIREFKLGAARVQVRAGDADDEAAVAQLTVALHALSRLLVAAPPRKTPWGPGQNDYVTLGPGVRAALRVTRDGRVKLTIPGGDLDVTDGDCTLGLGLLEASKRAAQIRVKLEERARKAGAR